jgi:RNA polymerase sigma-70 factor (ECF subfamily)
VDISTDRDLVDAARAGDERAFGTLVERHTAKLYRVALHMLGNRADAEDCVQDSWLTAWRQLRRYRADAALGTWLYRIATTTALMQLRRRRPTAPLESAAGMPDPSPAGDPSRSAESTAVRRALLQLTAEHRAVIVLREFAGLSYDELGAALGLTVPAARSRLHRARLMLAQLLQEWR